MAAFFDEYLSERSAMLRPPLAPAEHDRVGQISRVLKLCLGYDIDRALYQAHRAVLFSRDRQWHETVLLDWPARRLAQLLDTIRVEGWEHVGDEIVAGRGVLLVSAHFSLYSSLLPLWVGVNAGRYLSGRHVAVLLESGDDGIQHVLTERVDGLARAGMGPAGAVTLLDSQRAPGGARHLLAELQRGGAALVLPDAQISPAPHPTQKMLVISLGRLTIGVPRGVAWLAFRSRASVVPVHLRPDRNGHVVVFGRPCQPQLENNHETIQRVLQHLLDVTALSDPAAWDGWYLLDKAQRLMEDGEKSDR